MITKELLIKARDTLPQELCAGSWYEAETHRYCAFGWIAHTAGIEPIMNNHATDEFIVWRNEFIPLVDELIKANDECTLEHERYNRVKHVLNNWIERL